ncbi:MAG: LLM class flavin-dependent oxidoreductase [Chloroflexota bacterium]|nr:MAG: LLM class flavin-dependent oxidoreductase [Chloroflexota bacterium]
MKFGWISPAIGPPESDFVPLVKYQDDHIFPSILQQFDSVWVCDHFYGFDRKTDPFLEGFTALTWLAARHPNVLLGHHVLGVGYRSPALTAKMAGTLQALSGGRFVLGIGAGWREDEYRRYGWPFPKASVRIAQLDEAVQLIRRMWTEEAPTFTGKHFQITEAYAPPLPKPVPPVMIGGSGEQLMLPLVGRQADWWNTTAGRGLDAFKQKRDIVFRSAETAGRDPSKIVLTVTREAPLPTTSQDSQTWLDWIGTYAAAGVSHILGDFGHVTSTEPVLRFVEEVMTPLRQG